MQFILSDHNCEGQAEEIFTVLRYRGYTSLFNLELRLFSDVDLDHKSDDEKVWLFCQQNGYLLLTGNRTNDDGNQSLESVIRRLITPNSLPVLTISNLRCVTSDLQYCRHCAERLAEIVSDLDNLRGTRRLYLPK